MNIDSMIQGNPQALVTSYNGVLVADRLYARNDGEKCFFRGGNWFDSSSAGVFSLAGNNPRSYSYGSFGFRPAYILL